MTKHDTAKIALPQCPFCGVEAYKLETGVSGFARDRIEFICDTVYERDVRWKTWLLVESGDACERYERQAKEHERVISRLSKMEPAS